MSTSPGRPCSLSAIWLAIVAVGTKIAASCPSSRATRSCRSFTLGSSRFCSSPTRASAIACAHALGRLRRGVGAEVDHEGARYRPDVDLELLEHTLAERGEPAYRARQVWEWTARGAASYDDMTTLPKALRATLVASVPFSTLELVTERESRDGTVKALFRTADGHPVEAVLMRYRDGRRSLCLSSQSGCPLTCTFCATGAMRFGRNLTASEIVDQALHFRRSEPVNHAVYMGMGEPFLNFDNVLASARRLPDIGITPRRTTISTVGWMPGLRRFVDEVDQPIRLALSIHAADAVEALRARCR